MANLASPFISVGGWLPRQLPDDSTTGMQVEFGAHQVILVRTTDSIPKLPKLLQDSNALTMTVPQSKGCSGLTCTLQLPADNVIFIMAAINASHVLRRHLSVTIISLNRDV